jgi:hypothetical protein
MAKSLRPKVESALLLDKSIAIDLPRSVHAGATNLIPGGTVEVSIAIRGWSHPAVAAQPDPDRWRHVACNLRDPKTGESYFGPGAPVPQCQAITHDGQTFTWTAKPVKAWLAGREHLELILSFSDASANPPEHGSPVRYTLKIVNGA